MTGPGGAGRQVIATVLYENGLLGFEVDVAPLLGLPAREVARVQRMARKLAPTIADSVQRARATGASHPGDAPVLVDSPPAADLAHVAATANELRAIAGGTYSLAAALPRLNPAGIAEVRANIRGCWAALDAALAAVEAVAPADGGGPFDPAWEVSP